jgi:hypothetical protein
MRVRGLFLLVLVILACACASNVPLQRATPLGSTPAAGAVEPPLPTISRTANPSATLPMAVTPSRAPVSSEPAATPSPGSAPSSPPIPTPASTPSPVSAPTPTPRGPSAVTLGPEVRPTPGAYRWLRAVGKPDARASRDGIVVELWVPHAQAHVGRWVTIHVRVTNTRARSFAMDCSPVGAGIDLSDMFRPGRTWTGNAAVFKRRVLAANGMLLLYFRYRTGEGIDCPGGDIGKTDVLRPGQVLDIDMATLPRYFLGRQALPGGRVTVDVGFAYAPREHAYSKRRAISLSASVVLERRPFRWPSPGEMVDTAIRTPGLLSWIRTREAPRLWDNTTLELPSGSAAFAECFFGFTGPAPNGSITLGVFAYGGSSDLAVWGGALIDPWTLTPFKFATRDAGSHC